MSKCLDRFAFINLGGGSIAIAGDGGLRQWQINNKVNHIAHVPNSFFAMKYIIYLKYNSFNIQTLVYLKRFPVIDVNRFAVNLPTA